VDDVVIALMPQRRAQLMSRDSVMRQLNDYEEQLEDYGMSKERIQNLATSGSGDRLEL
jgi:hypothetical protein